MSHYDDRPPPIEVTCSGCGASWDASEQDGPCPNCGLTSYSYDASQARDFTAWQDNRRTY